MHFAQKCLCFKAFFRQGVFNSPDEHFRIRHVNILYYLEDNTLCIIEPTVNNAGFQQGKLVRRNKIVKNINGDTFHWKDFNIGIDICKFNKCFYMMICTFHKYCLLKKNRLSNFIQYYLIN